MAIRTDKPHWLRVRVPGSPRFHRLKLRARELDLATVCEEARCPNIGECWGAGTATFMIMGDTCTRGCRFCAVRTSRNPPPLDPGEPRHLAEAVVAMELDYVVLTSVDRDDLPDGGADHFARCVEAIREARPGVRVEALVPDFSGRESSLVRVLESGIDVAAHNVETVERLTPEVRDPRAGYRLSLSVLAALGRLDPLRTTKSSLMLGLGETHDEVLATLGDLREAGVDVVTLGQYLQPSRRHLEVAEFVSPEAFAEWEEIGLELGFRAVFAGPLVRSSFRAGELFHDQARAAN